jgi:hypothetical protein
MLGGSGISVPGCLTSEDEERETWTAESLRVLMWSFGFILRSDEKTSTVDVLKVTPWLLAL